MTQNIYDDPAFFARFLELKGTSTGQAAVPDFAKLGDLLPPLEGKTILDLGCGDGWFCRWARSRGVVSAHGVDISQNMLSRAREITGDDEHITYATEDLSDLSGKLPSAEYDITFSALALHYVGDLRGLLGEVFKGLKPGGFFYFSVEHPMWTATRSGKVITGEDGKKLWPVADYPDEGDRVVTWLAEGVVKQHRTLESYVSALIETGFEIIKLKEWGRPDNGRFANESWFVPEGTMPSFLLFGVRKKDISRDTEF
jgi:SAM-dependent methyltransferase